MSESSSPTMTVAHLTPSALRVAVITVLSALASIVVNAGLVWLAKASDPSLQHYSHFRLWDYGTLTAVGVIAAGAAWYVATRSLLSARHTFFRVAVIVTLALWLPDVWLLIKHEPTRAVVFLVIMHAAVALITYNFLVFGAPVGARAERGDGAVATLSPRTAIKGEATATRVSRGVWVSLMIAVGVEFLVGLVGMLYVPFNRPDGWLSHRGEAIYLFHAVLGGLLGVAAVVVVFHVSQRTPIHRVDRVAAVSGLCGVLVGAFGGALCVSHPLRLLGMALMFLGVSVAFFGYLIPMIDDAHPIAPGDASITS
jgi:hypothetical protein